MLRASPERQQKYPAEKVAKVFNGIQMPEMYIHLLHSPWLELFRLVLEFAAVVLGVRAYFDIRRQLDAANGLAAKLKSVSRTLSTRFIGHFPTNFPKIMQLLANARKSVRIMVDYADYGSLTAHSEYLNYITQLNKLGCAPEIDVRVVSFSMDEARRRIELDFGTPAKLKGYQNHQAINSLLKRKYTKILPPPDVFVQWLIDDQVHTEESLRRNGVHLATYSQLPFFCWIRDEDEEAVFSFPFQEDPEIASGDVEPFRSYEISFYTRETTIVKTLSKTFDEIYKKAAADGKPQ